MDTRDKTMNLRNLSMLRRDETDICRVTTRMRQKRNLCNGYKREYRVSSHLMAKSAYCQEAGGRECIQGNRFSVAGSDATHRTGLLARKQSWQWGRLQSIRLD
jgi:hypothetical protein